MCLYLSLQRKPLMSPNSFTHRLTRTRKCKLTVPVLATLPWLPVTLRGTISSTSLHMGQLYRQLLGQRSTPKDHAMGRCSFIGVSLLSDSTFLIYGPQLLRSSVPPQASEILGNPPVSHLVYSIYTLINGNTKSDKK